MKRFLVGVGLLSVLAAVDALIVSQCGANGQVGVTINNYSQKTGPHMLKTLKDYNIKALFTFPIEFLKSSSAVLVGHEILKAHHTLGYTFTSPKGKTTKDLNNASILADLRATKNLFKKLFKTELHYVTFPATDDAKENARLDQLANGENLVIIKHNLHLSSHPKAAKSTIMANFHKASSTSYIALIDGAGKDQPEIIKALVDRADNRLFTISPFTQCTAAAEKRLKKASHRRGGKFTLSSFQCGGRVNTITPGKSVHKGRSVVAKKSSAKKSGAKRSSTQKLAAKHHKSKNSQLRTHHLRVNPVNVRGFRANSVTAKQSPRRKTCKKGVKLPAKRAKTGDDKLIANDPDAPVTLKKSTTNIHAQKADGKTDKKEPCNKGKGCNRKPGVNANVKTSKDDDSGASALTLSIGSLAISALVGVFLMI